jgi:enediyne biosynthesis protein E4
VLGVLALSGASCPRTPPKDATTPSSVTAGSPAFREVTKEAGLSYLWEIAGSRPLNILQTIGNGCAFLDFDGDGSLDILLVGAKPALFKGDGKGHFTPSSALPSLSGHFLGCAVGDYDGDGFPDLYLSAYRGGTLLHNEQGKSFIDVTAASGLKPQPWGTSCAWVELTPGSGKLDLVVANYAKFGPEPGITQLCDGKDIDGKPVLTSCGPRHYEPVKATLFRNQGGGKFVGETLAQTTGRGLGIAACDFNSTGKLSLSFANDEIAGDLLQTTEPGRFKNIGQEAGTAYDRDSNVHGGMGTDWGDYDNDGKLDLVAATFQNEPKSLYHNEGNDFFTDVSYPVGLGAATRPFVAFGTRFFDYDNDGWLDLAFANGHVQDNIARIDKSTTYRQTSQLFHNRGAVAKNEPQFEEVSAKLAALSKPMVGRGLATGDYDNDGKVDLLIVDSEGEPLLLHNETPTQGHWVGLALEGSKSNRSGYGARVTLEAGGQKLVRDCRADGSYLSSSDSRVHFGLGAAAKVDKLEIRWPNGQTETLTDCALDAYTKVRQKS